MKENTMVKRVSQLMVLILLFTGNANSQVVKKTDLCNQILISRSTEVSGEAADHYAYVWEGTLWKLAGATFSDPEEVVIDKVKKMWERDKTLFKCENKYNVLKFAFDVSYTTFISQITDYYGCDINFVDPSDGKNVYDYIFDQFKTSVQNNGHTHTHTLVLKEYLDLIESVGGSATRPEKPERLAANIYTGGHPVPKDPAILNHKQVNAHMLNGKWVVASFSYGNIKFDIDKQTFQMGNLTYKVGDPAMPENIKQFGGLIKKYEQLELVIDDQLLNGGEYTITNTGKKETGKFTVSMERPVLEIKGLAISWEEDFYYGSKDIDFANNSDIYFIRKIGTKFKTFGDPNSLQIVITGVEKSDPFFEQRTEYILRKK